MDSFVEAVKVNVDDYKPLRVLKWKDYFRLELAVIMGYTSMAFLGSPGFGKTESVFRMSWLLLGNYRKGIFVSNSARYVNVWKDRARLPSDEQQRTYLPPNFEVYPLRKISSIDEANENSKMTSSTSSVDYLTSVGKQDTNLSDILETILKREEKSRSSEESMPILLILDDLGDSLKEKPILIGLKALLMRGFNLRVHLIITAQRPTDIPEPLRPLFRYVVWMNTGPVRNMSLRIINTYLQETFPNNAKVIDISKRLGPDKTAIVIKSTYSPLRDLEHLDKACPLPNDVKRVETYEDNKSTQDWMSSTRADVVVYWKDSQLIKSPTFTSLSKRLDQPSLYGQLGENIFYPPRLRPEPEPTEDEDLYYGFARHDREFF